MWQYIGVILALIVVGGLYWIVKPYFVWKKSSSANQGDSSKIVVINTDGKPMSLAEHLESKKNTKI